MRVLGCETIDELVVLWRSFSCLDFVENYRHKREFFQTLSEFFFSCDTFFKADDALTAWDVSKSLILHLMKTADDVRREISDNLELDVDETERRLVIGSYKKLLIKNMIGSGVCQVYDTRTNKIWIMTEHEFDKL